MTKNIVIGVLVATTLLFGYLAFPSSHAFGTVTGQIHYQTEQFFAGLKIGDRNATEVAWFKPTTCALIASSFTVSASTTVAMDCAVTGALPGDKVFSGFATSSAPYNGWEITGASASSTAGYDTFRVYNGTGASGVLPASLASSTPVMNIR